MDFGDTNVPSTLSFSDDETLSEGDFVIALGSGESESPSLGLLVVKNPIRSGGGAWSAARCREYSDPIRSDPLRLPFGHFAGGRPP